MTSPRRMRSQAAPAMDRPDNTQAAVTAPADVCRRCGACCAFFRVSFYWAEAPLHGLPEEFCEPLTPHLVSMAGTNRAAPRCCALRGEVGDPVTCLVYESRPSPCREVRPGDERCAKARAGHGLAPLPAASITRAPR